MSTDREVTRIVRSWLEEGATALPDRVLDAVLDQVPATPQRRSLWPARRSTEMSNIYKVLIAAAAVRWNVVADECRGLVAGVAQQALLLRLDLDQLTAGLHHAVRASHTVATGGAPNHDAAQRLALNDTHRRVERKQQDQVWKRVDSAFEQHQGQERGDCCRVAKVARSGAPAHGRGRAAGGAGRGQRRHGAGCDPLKLLYF